MILLKPTRLSSVSGQLIPWNKASLWTASLATNSANVKDDDLDFQRDFASQLSGFSTNMLGFQTALAQAGSDKGLANYDRTNSLETLLKDTVNLNKNALTAVDVVVYNIPVLGPILGPSASQCPLWPRELKPPFIAVVYDIKCLIDGILDAIENFTDATLNALKPLFKALLLR